MNTSAIVSPVFKTTSVSLNISPVLKTVSVPFYKVLQQADQLQIREKRSNELPEDLLFDQVEHVFFKGSDASVGEIEITTDNEDQYAFAQQDVLLNEKGVFTAQDDQHRTILFKAQVDRPFTAADIR